MNEVNASDITGMNHRAVYDAENNILTLKDYTYQGVGTKRSGIYYWGDEELTIRLEGRNKITSSPENSDSLIYGTGNGIYLAHQLTDGGTLIFTGNGSLEVSSTYTVGKCG